MPVTLHPFSANTSYWRFASTEPEKTPNVCVTRAPARASPPGGELPSSGANDAHSPAPSGGHGHHGDHDRHAGHSVQMFRDRFWITLALTVPTLIWSDMIQRWVGFSAPSFSGSEYVPALFGTAVYLYGGWVFLAGGVREIRDRLPGMMSLISLAISVAFFFSVAVTLGYPGDALWWELATLVTIMLLGHWIEMRSIFQASGAVRELAKLLPGTAERVVGERVEEVPVSRSSRRRGARQARREHSRGWSRAERHQRRQRIDDYG